MSEKSITTVADDLVLGQGKLNKHPLGGNYTVYWIGVGLFLTFLIPLLKARKAKHDKEKTKTFKW